MANILKPFQFEPIITVAEIQPKTDLAGTSVYNLWPVVVTELYVQPAH